MARPKGKQTNRDLTALAIGKLKQGLHRASHGLYVQVTERGSKSWVHKYTNSAGQLRHMGLGSVDVVTLAEARDLVIDNRRALRSGVDPLANRATLAKVHRFRDVAADYVTAKSSEWSSEKYKRQVPAYLERFLYPAIGDLDVSKITTTQMVDALRPIWIEKTVTASVTRGYAEGVLSYAKAMGWRDGPNPAAWNDNLALLLPSPAKVGKPELQAAMHYDDIPKFMPLLRAQDKLAARCLELLVLTGVRSNEAAGAQWREFDIERNVWTIPAARMKMRVEHVVPLSHAAITMLSGLPRGDELVFGKARDEAMRLVMADCMIDQSFVDRKSGKLATVRGFRATFATWAQDAGYAIDLTDASLAHAIGDVTRRYQRGDGLRLRAEQMQAWADYLSGQKRADP